jgi:peptidoglycan/xylan/chitin deacetylase (PgdA/CDA1 family)
VDDEPGVHDLSVPAVLFEAHLGWLRERCTLMPLDDLLSTPPELLPDRPVAITFDDGYLDNLLTAAPLLRRYDAPATCFLTSRWLDEPGEYWWDALERMLLRSASLPPVLDVDLPGGSQRLTTVDRDARVAAHWQLHEAMVHASIDERDRILARVRAWSNAGDMDGTLIRPMAAGEVRDLAAVPGVTIGAHTVNHLALPDQPAEIQEREIADCRAALGRVMGRPVDLFAYPYGSVNRQAAALVRRSCRWGLSCDDASLEDSFDAARVPRVEVKRWDVDRFGATLDRLFVVRDRRDPAFARLP